MTLNPNRYRKTLDALKPRILEATLKDLHKTLVELAVGSHVPVQALVAYAKRNDVLGALEGRTAVLDVMDVGNRKFYGYEEVTKWSDL